MKLKKILFSPVTTILAFVLAAALLLFSSVGGARAALTFFSETYQSQIDLYDIGVTLIENNVNVAWRNYNRQADGSWNEHTIEHGNAALLTNLLAEGESFKVGQKYTEALRVGNSGTINQYVRVTLYRYWVDEDGNKLPALDSSLIDVEWANLNTDWLVDESASTEERTVLYYNKLLRTRDNTNPFTASFTVKNDVKGQTTAKRLEDGTSVLSYDYDGKQFVLEARVDAVQENNAQAAVLSAWGRNVTVDESRGTLALR